MSQDIDTIELIGKQRVYISEKQGKRPKQEDFYVAKGGVRIENPEAWLKTTVDTLNKAARKAVDSNAQHTGKERGGSTAVIAVMNGNSVSVANLGDSPAVLFVENSDTGQVTAHKLTKDHVASDPEEQRRVRAKGGRIINVKGVPRVDGNLMITRVLGDFDVVGVSHEPDIRTFDVSDYKRNLQDRAFFCVSCDGLYEEGITPKAYAGILGGHLRTGSFSARSKTNTATKMTEYALGAGSGDNLTVMLAEVMPQQHGSVLAVFDGHAGNHVSKAAKEALEAGINKLPRTRASEIKRTPQAVLTP